VTINVLWSDVDGESSYIIVDSARTHPGVPATSYSLLNQMQHFPERGQAVEEGVQKIVVINEAMACSLCGNEADLMDCIRALRLDLASPRPDISNFQHHFANLRPTADFELSIAVAGGIEMAPFMVLRHPRRELLMVRRGHMHLAGSLAGEASDFIRNAIKDQLIDQKQRKDPETRLVAGLGIAMTAAMQFPLTDHSVGGAFFGARIDSHVHWQPDIVYVLYVPGHSLGDFVSVPTADAHAPTVLLHQEHRREVVATRVRDDVCSATSSIGWRGVAAGNIKGSSEPESWLMKWSKDVGSPFPRPGDYVVFVPISRGNLVVVPPSCPHLKHGTDSKFAISNVIIEALAPPEDGLNGLVLL
jgi:hypothetical protein